MPRTDVRERGDHAVVASTRRGALRPLDETLAAHGFRAVRTGGPGPRFSAAVGEACRLTVLDIREPLVALRAAREARRASRSATGVIMIIEPSQTGSRPLLRAVGRTVDAVVTEDRLDECLPIAVAATLAGQTCVPRGLHAGRGVALTHREREVLALVAAGESNAFIAGELYLAESTVKGHVTRIFTKLGVQSRAEAGALARRMQGERAWR
ncbi:MAG: response regulator transcription factor [Solirubrobacteraceae bacterium]|nr:response regulator transcription factor [Solirubrobacteraceae bacterium]